MKPRFRFHLMPNAHLDPVWLWDWREGLNEALTTVTTMLDLMDENPDLTFVRGEAAVYQHIQKTDAKTFERILGKIASGRWDVVGGTYVQPDSNLASTETLCRHFEVGLRFFEKELGMRPTVGWQPDSFGHPAGWPNILGSFGLDSFAFTRPGQSVFPLESPVFLWQGAARKSLLAYRPHWHGYCSERSNIPQILNETLKSASHGELRNIGVLMGLGNHGGGPTRRHLADVEQWRLQHPEVEVGYSTLHGFFQELKSEISGRSVAKIDGEIGYCLRGCYSSVQKFKSLYRHSETRVTTAEITAGMIQTALGGGPAGLEEAWASVLFNSFHDILPGSSIERAMEEQSAWTGLALHHAQRARFTALNLLAAAVETRVPQPAADAPADVPVLLWNSLPRGFSGPVEVETSLDYRPLFDYENRADQVPFALLDEKGSPLPFQEINTEHSFMPALPWRKRVVVNLDIPALGWRVVRLGLVPKKLPLRWNQTACRAKAGAQPSISNRDWQITDHGTGNIAIQRDRSDFLPLRNGLRLLVVRDIWGSWGGMNEEPDSYLLDDVLEEWKISQSEILEKGPERARLWTRWQGERSWLDLTFDLVRDVPWISIQGRLLWNQRSARLQLVIPSTGAALCDVPGATATRDKSGQVPIGRWCQRESLDGRELGLASDVLSDADFRPSETRLTLARATRYANDVPTGPEERPWQPAVDCGELKFRLCIFTNGADPDHVADSLVAPPVALPVRPQAGALGTKGSLGELIPPTVRLLSAKIHPEGGLELRIQNRGMRVVNPKFRLAGEQHSLGALYPQQIRTIVIERSKRLSKVAAASNPRAERRE